MLTRCLCVLCICNRDHFIFKCAAVYQLLVFQRRSRTICLQSNRSAYSCPRSSPTVSPRRVKSPLATVPPVLKRGWTSQGDWSPKRQLIFKIFFKQWEEVVSSVLHNRDESQFFVFVYDNPSFGADAFRKFLLSYLVKWVLMCGVWSQAKAIELRFQREKQAKDCLLSEKGG